MVSQSYANDLANGGIQVYKYKPGFIHQKIMIVDGKEALIGTVNLDYRSLYLHFENNVYLKEDPEISLMRKHFLDLIDVSINIKDDKKPNLLYRLTQFILKGFSSIL